MAPPLASVQPVLVVTDDAGVRELAQQALPIGGYAVAYAAPDATLVEAAAREHPRLLVLDLAGTSIVAAIEALRRRTSGVPILMLTAPDQDEAILAALEAGADDYLVKPFSASVLLARVTSVLRRRRLASRPPPPTPSSS